MKPIFNALLFLFFPLCLLTAQEAGNGVSDVLPVDEPAQAVKPVQNPVDVTRLATIKYGTETEIAALIQTLKNEGADYLDDELIAVAGATRNGKILSGIFTFFADREKKGLEERALTAIIERDIETSDTILSAIDYLGRVQATEAEDTLKELLDTRERRFMNAAFKALGRVGRAGQGGEAAEYLIDYFTNRDPGDENRRDIITAIGETRSVKGIEFLSAIAIDNDERIPLRMAAIDSLSKIGDPAGLDAVLAAVNAVDPNIRSTAVAALGPFSGEKVDAAILESFRDSYYRTRIAAAQASRERKLEAALPYLKFRSERDEVPQVKDEAIRALGAIGSEEALEIVNSLFIERKNSDRVRVAAADVLMKNKPDRYLAQLITELDEAKIKNLNPLYNGFLKVIGESRGGNLEDITRRFLKSGGIIEKSYALDMAVNNNLTGLAEDIRKVSEEKNESIARKARRTMEKLGIE
jgi:HEAT repeat protein